jgi:hypothetical protein
MKEADFLTEGNEGNEGNEGASRGAFAFYFRISMAEELKRCGAGRPSFALHAFVQIL